MEDRLLATEANLLYVIHITIPTTITHQQLL
jgi:hypothetical protein